MQLGEPPDRSGPLSVDRVRTEIARAILETPMMVLGRRDAERDGDQRAVLPLSHGSKQSSLACASPRLLARGELPKKRRGDGPHGRLQIIEILPRGSSSVRIVPGKFDRSPAPSSPASWHNVCVVIKASAVKRF